MGKYELFDLPRNLTVEERGNRLTIIKKSSPFYLLIPFLTAFLFYNFSRYTAELHDSSHIQIITNSVLVVVFLNALFYSVKRAINRLYIEISQDEISLSNRPISLFEKRIAIRTDTLSQLFVNEENKKVKTSSGVRRVTNYHLKAVLKSGEVVVLATFPFNYETARFIEQTIEEFLEIKDLQVKSEYIPEDDELF